MPEHNTTTVPLSPAPLMQLATGFWSFKTFAASIELGLYDLLAQHQGCTVEEVAKALDLRHRPADLLLAACASLDLLDKQADRYLNSPLADQYLVTTRPGYFGGFVRFCDQREYPAWHRVTEALRTDRPVTWDPATQDSVFSAEDPVMLELFWEAMHSISVSTARTLGEVYDFGTHLRLLDVGGGSGAFPVELAKRYKHLSASVYDLPHACRVAEKKIEAAGLQNVVNTLEGDFLRDDTLPLGYDAILLSLILHDWDEPTGRALLRKCRAALPSDGVLLICELLLNDERTGPPSAALMGMNMLVESSGGKNYSGAEYTAWLSEAGFAHTEIVPLDAAGANAVIVARPA
ncbi:methyltransferase [Streptomyces sp. NPDC050636]|uniref:methyltransferase n=1 Tax=Streptomyces sp. NPDC050636 TaxID=3154510 RepID=UPI00342298CC